jgi:Na+/melibiose symporter-like transporter
VSLTFGLIEGPTRGWASPWVWGTATGGLVALVAFLWWQARLSRTGAPMRAEPLIEVALWSVPEFRWGALAASAASVVGFVALFASPLYLQVVLGTDALGTGLRLLPLLGGLMVGFAVAIRLAAAAGPRPAVATGFVMIAVAALLGSRTAVGTGYDFAALWLTLFGAGFGMVLVTGQNLAIDALSVERSASGGALIQVMRQVSSVLGIAALVSVLNTTYRAQVEVAGLPAAAADAVRDSAGGGLAVAVQLGSAQLADSVRAAFVAGLADEMRITVVLAVVGLVLTLWKLPDTRPAGRAAPSGRVRVEAGG